MDFVATLQHVDVIPIRKAVTFQARGLDDAAAAAIQSTYERQEDRSFRPGGWFVVAIRQADAIDGPDVL